MIDISQADESYRDPHFTHVVGAAWHREAHLRKASLMFGFADVMNIADMPSQLTFGLPDGVSNDHFYIVSDGDEIPHPDAVRQAVEEYTRKVPAP